MDYWIAGLLDWRTALTSNQNTADGSALAVKITIGYLLDKLERLQ